MAWTVDEGGNVVWSGEGAAPDVSLPRYAQNYGPETQAQMLQLQTETRPLPGLGGILADIGPALRRSVSPRVYGERSQYYSPVGGPLTAEERQRLYGGVEGVLSAQERRARDVATEQAALEERPDLSGVVSPYAGGGMSAAQIDPSRFAALFALEETPQERAAIEAELADLQARSEAGSRALSSGWARVAQTNRIASDRASLIAAQAGPEAQSIWSRSSVEALRSAAQRANLESTAAGVQGVNISPDAGVQDWVGFMQAQAPRAGLFAQRMGDVLSRDLAFLAESAEGQGQAYQGELARTTLIQSANAAREHNRAVFNRTSTERQALANLVGQAELTNAQLRQQASQFNATQAAEAAAFDPFDTFLRDMIKVKTAPSIYTQPMMEKYGLSREAVTRYADSAASSIGVAQGLAQGTQ